jgi:hypothetical protein
MLISIQRILIKRERRKELMYHCPSLFSRRIRTKKRNQSQSQNPSCILWLVVVYNYKITNIDVYIKMYLEKLSHV